MYFTGWVSAVLVLTTAVPTQAADAVDLSHVESLYEDGQCDEVRELLLPREHDARDQAAAAYYLGQCDSSAGDYDSAIPRLRRAVELDPERSIYHQALGEAIGNKASTVGFLKAAGMAGDIRKAFEKAVELDPQNLDARLGLLQYFLEAPAIAGGSKTRALEQAAEIKKRDRAAGHLAYANIYRKKGQSERMAAEYRAAIEADPQSRDAHLGLAIHLTEIGSYDEAFELYDSWLEREPEDMSVLYQLGRTASIAGQKLDRGASALETYCLGRPRSEQPSLAWAHYRLGLIRQHQGSADGARSAFETALSLDPEHDAAKKALRKLR